MHLRSIWRTAWLKKFIDIYKILANDEKERTITLKIEAVYVYKSDDAKWNPDEHHWLKIFETLPGVFLKPFFCELWEFFYN